jgi:membrane-bound metal-dependent hydrolase YbcI (DUF457 family)
VALAPRVVRTPFDGFVLGVLIGLGFQLTEDVSYVLGGAQSGFGADQIGASAQVFVVRILSGVAGHILFTAVFATGLVYLLGTRAQPRRIGRGAALVLVAMTIHFIWDAQTAIANSLVGDETGANVLVSLMLPGLPLVALAVVVAVFRIAVRSEREGLRVVLAPEVARGCPHRGRGRRRVRRRKGTASLPAGRWGPPRAPTTGARARGSSRPRHRARQGGRRVVRPGRAGAGRGGSHPRPRPAAR